MRAAPLSDFARGARTTVPRRCRGLSPAVADGRAVRGYKRGCSGMFPGTSRQTPREPDLGNPYRVDLGTAVFEKFAWPGRATQKHDDNTMHDAHAKHDAHAPHEGNIAAFEAEHARDKAAHRMVEEKARATKEKLNQIDEQLQRVRDSHEKNQKAEIANKEAENLKKQSETDLKNAHSHMNAQLQQ